MSGLNDFFTGTSSPPQRMTAGVQTPGFRLNASGSSEDGVGGTNVSLEPYGMARAAFNVRFPQILGTYDTLLKNMAPGFSLVRAAREDAIRKAGSEAYGSLRQDLTNRRVMGSSFANAQLGAVQSDVEKQSRDAAAQSFLDETNATASLIQKESDDLFRQLARELDELKVATGYSTSLGQMISQNANFQQLMAQQAATSAGNALGSLASNLGGPLVMPSLTAAGTGIRNFLTPSSAGDPISPNNFMSFGNMLGAAAPFALATI